MARPDPARLDLSTYRMVRRMEPRFGDVDSQRHLNNVALARFYEDARVRFTADIGARAAFEPRHGLLVAEVTIQYLAEGGYPDVLDVGAGVLRIGRSSFTLGQALFQRGRCIGTSDTTLVYVHRAEGGARPLPDEARAILQAHGLRLSQPAQETSPEDSHA